MNNSTDLLFFIIVLLGSIIIIRQIILLVKTKGKMYREYTTYNKKGEPKEIVRIDYGLIDNTTKVERHPESLKKSILYVANDPFFKYIGEQIRENGSWCQNDGVPSEIMKQSREYRKENE